MSKKKLGAHRGRPRSLRAIQARMINELLAADPGIKQDAAAAIVLKLTGDIEEERVARNVVQTHKVMRKKGEFTDPLSGEFLHLSPGLKLKLRALARKR